MTPDVRAALIEALVNDPDLPALVPQYGYIHRLLLAFDEFIQAFFNGGQMGVSISARSGTAKLHDRVWGCWMCALLNGWLGKLVGFGSDPVTKQGHCEGAIDSDILRALWAIKNLWGYDTRYRP